MIIFRGDAACLQAINLTQGILYLWVEQVFARMTVSLTKGYHMEQPNVHLTPQKTNIQQDVPEIQSSSICRVYNFVASTF